MVKNWYGILFVCHSIDSHRILSRAVSGEEVRQLHRGHGLDYSVLVDHASTEIDPQEMELPRKRMQHHRERQIELPVLHIPEKCYRLLTPEDMQT